MHKPYEVLRHNRDLWAFNQFSKGIFIDDEGDLENGNSRLGPNQKLTVDQVSPSVVAQIAALEAKEAEAMAAEDFDKAEDL